MTHPLPHSHALAEPWFQYLRSQQMEANAPMRGLRHPVRSLLAACLEVSQGRAQDISSRPKNSA